MTAGSGTYARRAPALEPGARALWLGPVEGWSSVLLLGFMCALVGWAIDDSWWVMGPPGLTDALPWAGVLGMAWGAGAGVLRRGRFVTHVGGAIVATFVLSLFVGAAIRPGGSPGALFQATSDSVVGAYLDLVVHAHLTTTQVGHFVLILGILCWGTGQFAGYTAFGHRRPLAAVLVPGGVLLANVVLTRLDQFGILVLFSIAALLFLLRFHIADEERAWRRHRIADVGDAVSIYLRAGATFIVLAIVGSLLLTRSASSAPLAGAWTGMTQRLYEIGNTLARLFPAGGPGTRIGGAGFGSTVTVSGAWVTDDAVLVTIRTRDGWTPVKWRAAAYDRLSGSTWSLSSPKDVAVAAGDPPLAGTRDAPLEGVAYRTEDLLVSGPNGAPGIVLSPGIPIAVDRATRPTLAQRGDESFWSVVLLAAGGEYRARVAMPDLSDPKNPETLTANRLRSAGTDYPPDLVAIYTDIQPGSVGPATRALAAQIVTESGAANPYDVARAMESYLRDGNNFTYDTNVTDVPCGAAGVVECFVVNRRGYCEHYASTMAMMLRIEGIPSRLVEGYLPGDRDGSLVETIRRNRAHAWVQAWFPGVGWVDFDPTGGGVGRPSAIPAGSVAASPAPSIVPASAGPNGEDGPRIPARGPGSATPPVVDSSEGALALLFILFALLGLAAAAGGSVYRRLGRPAAPESAYRTVAAFAARLGHPRRPTQTVYEYVGTLADAVPSARPELELVGHSAVEAVYGRKRLPPSRLAALGAAQRRLRLALLRLILVRRRPKARRRPRR